ncbi:MAG: hypothetical protein LBD66_01295 [Holosporales bacterium]|jgi:hypothetical protein|nr:hypothetical protein [Holosporales bacterium]
MVDLGLFDGVDFERETPFNGTTIVKNANEEIQDATTICRFRNLLTHQRDCWKKSSRTPHRLSWPML